MIEIVKSDLVALEKELVEIEKKKLVPRDDLPDSARQNVLNLLSDRNFKSTCSNVLTLDYLENMSYASLSEIEDSLGSVVDKIREIKEQVDAEMFLKDGYKLDIQELKIMFRIKGLHKTTPNFNFDKLDELYKNPPKYLDTYYDSKQKVLIDSYLFRKYILAIVQSVFDEMDLVCGCVGAEGAGKSLFTSQQMLILHWLLDQLGVTTYDFDIKEMYFNTLSKLREAEDKYFDFPYRIVSLDEGNELNRQNWKEEEVQTFFQRLRRERYNKRLKFINLPVLGELMTNIVLSRINFIFETTTKSNVKTGTLKKGEANLYIIPRDYRIYSPLQKREISKVEIKQKLYENLKDKSYLKGIPQELIIKKVHFNAVWGYPKEQYVKILKESNKAFTVKKGITFGEVELFMFYKTNPTPKKLGIKTDDARYASVAKMCSKVKAYFENNPDLMLKYDAMFARKVAEKESVS